MKKLLFLLLTIAAVLCCTAWPSAAVSRPVGLNPAYWGSRMPAVRQLDIAGEPVSVSDSSTLVLRAGDRLQIPLEPEMFIDENGKPLGSLSLSQLKAGKVAPSVTVARGRSLVQKNQLILATGNGPCVEIQLVDQLVSVDKEPISMTLRLQIAGELQTASEITLTGVMANATVAIGESNTQVDLSQGLVGKAAGRVTGVELILGEGASMTADLEAGQKIYATARCREPDITLAERYPSLEMVYTFETVNLPGTSAVLFTLPRRYYLYDGNGNYCGTTDMPVVIASRYYLSASRLDRLEF